jgi:hypothetical protein
VIAEKIAQNVAQAIFIKINFKTYNVEKLPKMKPKPFLSKLILNSLKCGKSRPNF